MPHVDAMRGTRRAPITSQANTSARELDLAVAVKIFGYRTVRVPTVGEPHDYFLAPHPGTASVMPHYSAEIGEAWPVVEWARASDARWLRYQAALQAEVAAELPGTPITDATVWRHVRPDHLCRAALRVVPVRDVRDSMER